MKHKPVPIGVVLTGVLYFGLLFYWQWDELSGTGAARDAAIFGIVLATALTRPSTCPVTSIETSMR